MDFKSRIMLVYKRNTNLIHISSKNNGYLKWNVAGLSTNEAVY